MATRTPLTPGTYVQPVGQTTTTLTQPITVGQPMATTTANGNTVSGALTSTVQGMTNPQTWCLPFIIYVILSVIGFILMLSNLFSSTNKMTTGQKWMYLILSLVWLIFFGWLIWYLCRRGHNGWAWFVLFLPLILLALFYLFIAGAIGAFWAGADAARNMTPAADD